MKKYIKEIIPYIIVIILVLLIKTYLVSPIRVNGSSMHPTLKDGDIMILNKIHYLLTDIQRFDIVVIKTENSPIIKRIIGLPGDKIEYKNNELYVNNKKVIEEFLHTEIEDYNIEELGKVTVPKNNYFVLGDNRKNSMDSRFYGFIEKKNIQGRAKTIILPLKRFGNK